MGVAVQLMVDAQVSGVLFTCNPVSGDPSMIAVNASWGLGLAVVGGEVTPDDFLSKVTGEVVRERIHVKDVEYVPDAGGRGAVGPCRRSGERSHASTGRARCARRGRLPGRAHLRLPPGRRVGDREGAWAPGRPVRSPVAARDGVAGTPVDPENATAMALVMSMFGAERRRRRRQMALSDDDVREILRLIDDAELESSASRRRASRSTSSREDRPRGRTGTAARAGSGRRRGCPGRWRRRPDDRGADDRGLLPRAEPGARRPSSTWGRASRPTPSSA